MSFTDGCRIAQEFLDDIVRVYQNKDPAVSLIYHETRYRQALQSGIPEQLGLLFAISTRLDVTSEMCQYASFCQVGVPELNYVYA